MWDLHTMADMRLLLLVCLLTWPGITSADETGFVTVAEGDDAVLPCSLSSKDNIEQMIFDWKKDGGDQKQVFYYVKGSHYNNGRSGQDQQFKGRVLHFQDELKFGNASIKIRNTELADNGSYTCVFPEKQTSNIILYIDAGLKERPVPGAAPKPDITSLDGREDYALLQCKVHGVPKPRVEWKDSAGNVLHAKKTEIKESEGRFYITLQIIVTNSDNFTCVATQETIYHRINGTISVYVHERTSKEGITAAVGAGVGAGVAVSAVGALMLGYWAYKLKAKEKKMSQSRTSSVGWTDTTVGLVDRPSQTGSSSQEDIRMENIGGKK